MYGPLRLLICHRVSCYSSRQLWRHLVDLDTDRFRPRSPPVFLFVVSHPVRLDVLAPLLLKWRRRVRIPRRFIPGLRPTLESGDSAAGLVTLSEI